MKNDIIVFGGGCFWCTEAVFEMFKGVINTMPGYAGGNTKDPTYWQVATGTTGHAEVLQIEYDAKVISLDVLLDIFFTMHDPTTLNRQGPDVGTDYRSIILYTSNSQKAQIEKVIKNVQSNFSNPIVTEVRELDKFYPAEEEHQRFYDRNANPFYCSVVIGPKVAKITKKFKDILK